MSLRQSLGQGLQRRGFVQTALLEGRHPFEDGQGASAKIWIALVLMFLQVLLGWPAVALMGSLAVATEQESFALYGAPLFYGASWVALGLAVVIGGRDIYVLSKRMNQYLLARFVRYLLS